MSRSIRLYIIMLLIILIRNRRKYRWRLILLVILNLRPHSIHHLALLAPIILRSHTQINIFRHRYRSLTLLLLVLRSNTWIIPYQLFFLCTCLQILWRTLVFIVSQLVLGICLWLILVLCLVVVWASILILWCVCGISLLTCLGLFRIVLFLHTLLFIKGVLDFFGGLVCREALLVLEGLGGLSILFEGVWNA